MSGMCCDDVYSTKVGMERSGVESCDRQHVRRFSKGFGRWGGVAFVASAGPGEVGVEVGEALAVVTTGPGNYLKSHTYSREAWIQRMHADGPIPTR